MATPFIVPTPASESEALAVSRASLYTIETTLQSLLDAEASVTPEEQERFNQKLAVMTAAAVEKRDRVGQFLAHLESQVKLASVEVERLQLRRKRFERAIELVETGLTRVIESLPHDANGKRKSLEGHTVTLSLRGCDKRVEVTDETSVPTHYKRVTVTLPANTWELVCDSLDLDLRDQVLDEARSTRIEVATSLVKTDLKANIPVPGAKLAGGTYVVRK